MNFLIKKGFSQKLVKLPLNQFTKLEYKYNECNFNDTYDLTNLNQKSLKKILQEKIEHIPKPLFINPLTNNITLYQMNISASEEYCKLGYQGLIANISAIYLNFAYFSFSKLLTIPLFLIFFSNLSTKISQIGLKRFVKEIILNHNTIQVTFYDGKVETCDVKDFSFDYDSLEKVSNTKNTILIRKCMMTYKINDKKIFMTINTLKNRKEIIFCPNIVDLDMLKYLSTKEVEKYDYDNQLNNNI